MSFSLIIGQIMTGLVLGGILALVVCGFVLVFGMMDIINFAHGIFFALGSYFAYTSLAFIGNFWITLLIVPFTVGILGFIIELLILRPLSGRDPVYSLLSTFGFTLAALEAIRLIWGKAGLPFSTPDLLVGASDLGVLVFPTYRLFVMVVTGVIVISLWLFIEKTDLGSIIRAGTLDPIMAKALGINIAKVWSLVFGLGCVLAAIAGVLAAPMQGIYPEMGMTIIMECFVIVVIAGLGTIIGAVISSLLVGVTVSMTTLIYPPMANVVIYLLMIVVLLIRPIGLFGTRGMNIVKARPTMGFLSPLLRNPICLLFPILVVLPFLTSYPSLATQILIYAIFASGYNILFGYTGLLSFGHAAYFGLGAYGFGLVIFHFNFPQWLGLITGVTFATLGATVFGYLSLRTRGAYFALITLAFSQALFFLAYHAYTITGGDDGLRNIPVLCFKIFGITVSPIRPLSFYYFIFIITIMCILIICRLLNSPLGRSLEAIRDNEERALACGVNVKGIKLLSFVLSGFFCGLAGALNVMFHIFVHPESLHWMMSGEVVLMTLLGGKGTFFGPILGAGVFMYLQDFISSITESWQLFVGTLFVLCVIFFPMGIWGSILTLLEKVELFRYALSIRDEKIRAQV